MRVLAMKTANRSYTPPLSLTDELPPSAPRAVRTPVMWQDWRNITFMHWRYPVRALQPLLPAGLTIDSFEGTAWLSLTPFEVANLRRPPLPALPWLSHFPETNVRTYVRGPGGEPGVWFFSLEAGRALAAWGGKVFYSLPYHHASMGLKKDGRWISYYSSRSTPTGPATTNLGVRVREPLCPDDLATFLTARFRLYTVRGNTLLYVDVEHEAWPLAHADIWHLDQTLIATLGLGTVRGDPIVHFSSGVRTKIGPPRSAAARESGL